MNYLFKERGLSPAPISFLAEQVNASQVITTARRERLVMLSCGVGEREIPTPARKGGQTETFVSGEVRLAEAQYHLHPVLMCK